MRYNIYIINKLIKKNIMNGTKDEKCGQGLCSACGLRPVYLGMILFVIGLLMRGGNVPEILMIIGLLVIVTGILALLFQKK
jgi:hypothetical protein